MNFPYKDGQHQPVLDSLMPVVGTELAAGHNEFTGVIPGHVDQTLRDHQRDTVHGITQPPDIHTHQVEALPEHLVAERKWRRHFSHDRYLVVFNNLI